MKRPRSRITPLFLFSIALVVLLILGYSIAPIRSSLLGGVATLKKALAVKKLEQRYQALLDENTQLKIELAKLKDHNAFLLPTALPRTVATVLLYLNTRDGQYVILDHGCSDTVTQNAPLTVDTSLVGRIISCNRFASKAELISNNNFKASAQSLTHQIDALYEVHNHIPLLSLTNNTTTIIDKEIIITSGKDGIFPRGLIIGTYNAEQQLVIPLINLSSLTQVTIHQQLTQFP